MYTVNEHIEKSFARLCESEYRIENLFKDESYRWYGDWEGRALLAFCNLFELTGKKIPAMDAFVRELPSRLNREGFLGPIFNSDAVDEQQLSGHSWLLRGLAEHYRIFGDAESLDMSKGIFEGLYLPAMPCYKSYPITREARNEGSVSGNVSGILDGWLLSTDIGCAFICLDGVSAYYEISKDSRAAEFIENAAGRFGETDKLGARVQTHATLTASRGLMRYYSVSGKKEYFAQALENFNLYISEGMTYTYENFNWFGRKDTWTEPCAVVDSLLLAVAFYRETGDEKYRTLARRIWFNGLSFCHRANGGAGTNSCVYEGLPYLYIHKHYEAPFCCTMRYNEGLLCAKRNLELWETSPDEPITVDEKSRSFKGDLLLVTDPDSGSLIPLADLAFPEKSDKKYKVY